MFFRLEYDENVLLTLKYITHAYYGLYELGVAEGVYLFS